MLGNSTILSAMHNKFSDKNAIFHTFYALCANELGISKKRVFWPQKKTFSLFHMFFNKFPNSLAQSSQKMLPCNIFHQKTVTTFLLKFTAPSIFGKFTMTKKFRGKNFSRIFLLSKCSY